MLVSLPGGLRRDRAGGGLPLATKGNSGFEEKTLKKISEPLYFTVHLLPSSTCCSSSTLLHLYFILII
jgi:hypothetical protein